MEPIGIIRLYSIVIETLHRSGRGDEGEAGNPARQSGAHPWEHGVRVSLRQGPDPGGDIPVWCLGV